jgi:cysteine desulfurase/selenocysteine lyase
VLFAKGEALSELEPLCVGGGTIEEVGVETYTLEAPPARFEAGTPPIAEAIGLGAAVDYLKKVGLEAVAEHERALIKKMCEGLSNIPKVEIYGPSSTDDRGGILAFNIEGLGPHDVAAILDNSANIMVRSGHHCAMPLHTKLLGRPEGTVRASVYLYNTEEEIDKFTSTVGEIVRTLT